MEGSSSGLFDPNAFVEQMHKPPPAPVGPAHDVRGGSRNSRASGASSRNRRSRAGAFGGSGSRSRQAALEKSSKDGASTPDVDADKAAASASADERTTTLDLEENKDAESR